MSEPRNNAVITVEAPAATPVKRLRTGIIVKSIVLAAVVMLVAETSRIFLGPNFFTVVPGRCYRAAQPNARFLENAQRHYGIRAIFNLRDENDLEPWYNEEKQTAERLGIQLVNAGLATREQPPEHDFHRLVLSMHACPEPMVIHCANGNDRTGLASALYLLLRTPTPLPEARKQLSLRYGHFAIGKTLCLHRILDGYENWLHDTRQDHTSERLCWWAVNVYRPEN